MTNADKFLKDGITGNEIFNLAQELGEYLTVNCKANYVFVSDINLFFQQPRTPTLTEDERAILRNIAKHSDFEKIGRDKIGGLYVTCRISIPTEEKWTISFYDHLFQFIKDGEEYEISELLKE